MIDVHTHVVPPVDYAVGPDPRWPELQIDHDGATVVVAGRPFRRVAPAAYDLARRLDDMASTEVRAQVLSPMPELFSYWAPPVEAAAVCRRVNEWIAAAVADHPSQFSGLGIVPLQDADRAAEEVAWAAAAGLAGVMVGSNVDGPLLSDPAFVPFFEAADRAAMAVFVHSFHPPQASRLPKGGAGSAVSFPQEIALGVAAVIGSGLLERFPRLRLGASHGGGGLVFTLGRMAHAWGQGGELRERLPQTPWHYASRIYYDTLIFNAASLRFLIDTVGPHQVVVGSDYPFSKVTPGWPLGELADELGADVVRVVEEESAVAFLGAAGAALEAPPATSDRPAGDGPAGQVQPTAATPRDPA